MRRLSRSLVPCFALLFSLSHCSSPADDNGTPSAGSPSVLGSSGAGTTTTGGTGNPPVSTSGGTNVAPGSGGTTGSPGGTTGSPGGTGATTTTGGTQTTQGGTGTVTAGASGSGTQVSGGTTQTSGGSPGQAGAAAGSAGAAPDPNAPDARGKTNAKPGSMTSTPLEYFKLGEIRIINNNWGSKELGCGSASTMSIFVNQDKSFGWNFNRQNCDTGNSNQKPDFPQVEFGIHPFGIGNSQATSPEFSSTTLLPRQIKDIKSASVTIDNMNIQLQKSSSWNITFEFWLSEKDPMTQGNAGVYAELMTFWGWQKNRWPAVDETVKPEKEGGGDIVTAGQKQYTLWVQRDGWGGGWRYFQFRDNAGPSNSFSGKIDVKPLIDYLLSRGANAEQWVTRLEVGSEIDDETQGTVTIKNITFEVNGETRSPVFGE